MPDPAWHEAIEARLAALGVPAPRRVEIVAEVRQHLADAQRASLTPEETERLIRELAQVERRVPLDPPVLGKGRQTVRATICQDLTYAARSLRLNPAYTAIVIATLTLGIGANAAIFSVADAVMLRPYPYPDIDRIVALNETTRRGQQMSVSWPTFEDWTVLNQSFEHLGIYRNALVTLTGMGQAEGLSGAVVSSEMFGAMGIGPAAGRTFAAEDDKPGAARTAIISERLWRARFESDPGVLGRVVILNNEPHVIVGIMPPGMRFPSRLTDVWLPLGPIIATFPPRGAHPGLFAMGRLKPGVSFDRAVADMDSVARRLEAQYPASNTGVAVRMTRYYEQIVEGVRPTLYVLLGAVGFVLLIGCANLANLMLARAERRQREIAVRAALGAERWRIVQQLLTESLLLSVAGGTLGVLLATWIVKLFVASHPTSVPRIDLIGVDGRVVAFAALLSVLTGVIFGLVPALRASAPDLTSALKATARGAGLAPSRRFRSALVVVEVALALVLLVGAGLMIRSFARLMSIEPGFDPAGVVTMRVRVPLAKYPEVDRWVRFHAELVQRVAAIPGVAAAAVNSAVPLEGGGAESSVMVEGRPMPPPNAPATMCLFQAGSPDYLRAMGIQVTRGRAFSDRDTGATSPVAIVDDSLVSRLFPGEDPLGKRIAFEDRGHDPHHPDPIWREIVGVVRHVRHYGIASEPPFVQIYTPLEQLPLWFQQRRPILAIFARTSLPADALTSAVRREMAAIDPDIPVAGVQTMESYLSRNTEQPRLSVMLLAGLGGLALLLAAIGIYGVVSYSVAQRTQEIGVRMALGATGAHVLRMVVGQSLVLVAAGVAIGTAAALALGSVLRSLLFEVSPHDPVTLAAIAAGLALVGIVAGGVPALRATRVDPLVALRTD